MEEFLSNLYSNSSAPVWSALILGLMTAMSPCPLATNISAIGFIGRDIENRNRVFYNGLIYTLGRTVSYTLLAAILYFGADQLKITSIFQQYGEKILGPLLIVIGLIMLDLIRISFPGFDNLVKRFQQKKRQNYLDVFLIGLIFAMAFCPYSGVLYFGLLIPLTIKSATGLLLPVVFAIATGIPVIIFAWLLAFAVSEVGRLFDKIKAFEIWFRRIVALIFIGIGVYYSIVTLM